MQENVQKLARRSISNTKLYFLKKEAAEILKKEGYDSAVKYMKKNHGYRGFLAILSISGRLGRMDAE